MGLVTEAEKISVSVLELFWCQLQNPYFGNSYSLLLWGNEHQETECITEEPCFNYFLILVSEIGMKYTKPTLP